MSATKKDKLSWSETLQGALIGHAFFVDAAVWRQIDHYVTQITDKPEEVWISPVDAGVVQRVEQYRRRHGAHPKSWTEFLIDLEGRDAEAAIAYTRRDAGVAKRYRELAAATSWALIERQLQDLAKDAIAKRAILDGSELYKGGAGPELWQHFVGVAKALEAVEAGGTVGLHVDILSEKARRIERQATKVLTGLGFLDDALHSLAAEDVVVVGAPTGSGKTQLFTHIALHNAAAGKRVAWLSLEARQGEVAQRLKYTQLLQRWRDAGGVALDRDLCPKAWGAGDLDDLFGPYEEAVTAELADLTADKIQILDEVPERFGIDDLKRLLAEVGPKVDLVLLDHLHMIDVDDRNANAEMKRIMHVLTQAAKRYQIAIIAVAHIRKTDTGARAERLVPRIDDLHGSSEIAKIATAVVMFARIGWDDVDGKVNDTSTTAFNPVLYKVWKNREAGRLPAGIVLYDWQAGTYLPQWCPVKLGPNATVVLPPDRAAMPWAKRARFAVTPFDARGKR